MGWFWRKKKIIEKPEEEDMGGVKGGEVIAVNQPAYKVRDSNLQRTVNRIRKCKARIGTGLPNNQALINNVKRMEVALAIYNIKNKKESN